MAQTTKHRLIVVGNGMTGYKFLELLSDSRGGDAFAVMVFGEEPRPAYDRVHLTDMLASGDPEALSLAPRGWYHKRGLALRTGARVAAIDRAAQTIALDDGETVAWDTLVLATGSAPFVPPIPGREHPDVFVYRTIEDLEAIAARAQSAQRAAVLGGGLLGLEAARALHDLGLHAHVVEAGGWLMGRQLDAEAGAMLQREVERLGLKVHTGAMTREIAATDAGLQLHFADERTPLDVDMVVVSAGIRPRDELARQAGIAVGERGGIAVDDQLRTSDPRVFAVGECALHEGQVYGLVAPCYQMAEVAVRTILGDDKAFRGADLSTTLKLMGVDVATVGESVLPPGADPTEVTAIAVRDEIEGVYKKLIVERESGRLRGAILLGNTADYPQLVGRCRSGEPLPGQPISLIVQAGDGAAIDELGDAALVCTCNNVTKGAICQAVAGGCTSAGAVATATSAGTGCGGCKPAVGQIVAAELKRLGQEVRPEICVHFPFSRRELVDIVKVQGYTTYDEVLEHAGRGGAGCEVCQPTVASILASLQGQTAADQPVIQDTNDRFLANIQRGGTYSVVPRVPAGEITPAQLIVLGQVAERYDLYTKITGGQRIDLFGARVDQLPAIWAELVAAGFESGHAYAKGMRTVKSCVGSTWCRFGVLDSTAFAIAIEHRYKGLRAPHKLKSAVSGCIRECAEARSKDFGVIATESGWNLYVGGNGGANPRHADLLAGGLSDEQCLRLIDRFLMYYILTAEPLTRTAKWLDELEGGVEQLQRVVVDDVLGICAELDARMAALVGAYRCEWAQVVNDPELQRRFAAFANDAGSDESIAFVRERGQKRPASGGGFVELQRIGRLDAVPNREPEAVH